MFGKTYKKEVKGNVVILAVRSNSGSSVWPRSQCVLSVDSAVDCRAYSGVVMLQRHLRKKYNAAGATEHGGELCSVPSGIYFYYGLCFNMFDLFLTFFQWNFFSGGN